MDQETKQLIEKMQKQIKDLEEREKIRENLFNTLSTSAVVKSSRVQIENLEGCFKTFAVLPTAPGDMKNGTMFVTSDLKIGVIIDGAIKSVVVS